MMYAFSKTALTYAMMYDLLRSWHWPVQHKSETGIDSFSPTRAKASREAGTHKCTASQGRSLLPVIAAILREAVMENAQFTDRQKEFAKPLLFLADAVEELEAAARYAADPARFQRNAEAFLETFVRPSWDHVVINALADLATKLFSDDCLRESVNH